MAIRIRQFVGSYPSGHRVRIDLRYVLEAEFITVSAERKDAGLAIPFGATKSPNDHHHRHLVTVTVVTVVTIIGKHLSPCVEGTGGLAAKIELRPF